MVCGTDGQPQVELTLLIDGVAQTTSATGAGPVDAAFNAIQALYPHEARLELYQVHAVTAGTDAQAEVSTRLEENGLIATGYSSHIDTMVASVRAYVNALNKVLARRDKRKAAD